MEYDGKTGRLRAIFTGKPRSGPQELALKEVRDRESKGAAWASVEDCVSLANRASGWSDGWLRAPEPLWWPQYIAGARESGVRFAAGPAFISAERRGPPPEEWQA